MENQDDFWHKLDRQYRSRLIRFVNARLFTVLRRQESPGYAEDVVNETLHAAYEKFGSFDAARGALEAWIFAIARNKTFDFLRRHGELLNEEPIDDAAGEPQFLYQKGAKKNPRTTALRQALKQLTPYEQELLICRLGNQLSYEEIERYFNFSVKRDTLRVHVNRAEARLRQVLSAMPEFADLQETVYGN